MTLLLEFLFDVLNSNICPSNFTPPSFCCVVSFKNCAAAAADWNSTKPKPCDSTTPDDA